MTFGKVLLDVEDRIAFITINNPEKYNAISDGTCKELLQAFQAADADETVKVCVLRGAGKAFCSGGDISSFSGISENQNKKENTDGLLDTVNELVIFMKTCRKPIIASVQGPAAGAGSNLVLCCDYIICADNARFIETFVNIGLIPDMGGIGLLAKAVGVVRAADIALTGRTVHAAEMKEIGLATVVCPLDQLQQVTLEAAQKFAASPRESMAQIKRLLYMAQFDNPTFADYLLVEDKAQGVCFASDDLKEGAAAFLEKRKPNYK